LFIAIPFWIKIFSILLLEYYHECESTDIFEKITMKNIAHRFDHDNGGGVDDNII
jgi:hypothetical protein